MIHLLLTVAVLGADPKPIVKSEHQVLVGQHFELDASASGNVKRYRWTITPRPMSVRKLNDAGSVVLITHDEPAEFRWDLIVTSPDGEMAGTAGVFLVVGKAPRATAALPAQAPRATRLPAQADEEEADEPPAATAEIARQWLDEIEGLHRDAEARRIATAFVQEANALAGGLAKIDTFVEDVAILSKGSLTAEAWQRWTPFFEQLGEQFDALESAGLLESTEDYIDELMALAKVLKQFAAGKT